jgi:hypothetical protein
LRALAKADEITRVTEMKFARRNDKLAVCLRGVRRESKIESDGWSGVNLKGKKQSKK